MNEWNKYDEELKSMSKRNVLRCRNENCEGLEEKGGKSE